MKQYRDLVKNVLSSGVAQCDGRTGHVAKQLPGEFLRFDLRDGFPAVTIKKLFFKPVIHELLWFISGDCTNIEYLKENDVHIWDEWADNSGEVGPIYGYQWRSWRNHPGHYPIDQLKNLIEELKHNPYSRRHVVSAWQVSDLHLMALAPCHVLFQITVIGTSIHMSMYQRSADLFLGLPFNIASYALLLQMLAQETRLQPGILTITIGNAHLYDNQWLAAEEMVSREPLDNNTSVVIADKPFFDLSYEDFTVLNYTSHPAIKVPVIK